MTYTRDMIVARLKAKPFRPFKLKLVSGRILDIREPEDLWVGLSGNFHYDPDPKRDTPTYSQINFIEAVMDRPVRRLAKPVRRRAKAK